VENLFGYDLGISFLRFAIDVRGKESVSWGDLLVQHDINFGLGWSGGATAGEHRCTGESTTRRHNRLCRG
jgi:hypothetical protein